MGGERDGQILAQLSDVRGAGIVHRLADDEHRAGGGISGYAIAVEDRDWTTGLPRRGEVRFFGRNAFGVLDHDVTPPSGTVIANPVRVLSHPNGAEKEFTVRHIELNDAEFARNIETVAADLDRLAGLLSSPA